MASFLDIIAGIVGIGSAAASYQAGQDAARAAKAEAAYNIFAADAQIGNITRSLPIQLRAINDTRAQVGIAHEAANISRQTAGVHSQRASYLNTLASHTQQSAGYTKQRAGLKGQEASLTREAASNLKARSALALQAAEVGRLGIENTVFNAEVQEQLAAEALFEGEFDVETTKIQLRQMRGAADANAAARNVVVNSGSAAAINTSITFMGDREISKIRREAERQALSHEVQATNLRHSIHGQELAIAGHELSALEHDLSSRQTELGADYTALEGQELMHRARGQELQAQDQRIQSQYARISHSQALLGAREQEARANQLHTKIAEQQYQVGTSLVEIQDLERRKKLFEAQGKYGARAATLQGVTGAVSGLVNTALDFANRKA